MTSPLYFAFVLLASQTSAPTQGPGEWPGAMASSNIATQSPFVKRVLKALQSPAALPKLLPAAPTSSSGQPFRAGGNVHVPRMNSPEVIARHELLMAEYERVVAEENKGHNALARRMMEADIVQPGGEAFSMPLMDLEISQGDYVNAYKVAVPFVNTSIDPRFFIRASLVASSLGEVYTGQKEFLLKLIQGNDPTSEASRALTLPGNSPQVLAALSHILYADELDKVGRHVEAASHYEAALAVDPGNPSISIGLATELFDIHDYSAAIKAAEAGLPRAGTGYFLIVLTGDLSTYRSDLRRFGDGHAPPDPAADIPIRSVEPPHTIHP
jgi:tetratricopeptide (TPR) repeat protein